MKALAKNRRRARGRAGQSGSARPGAGRGFQRRSCNEVPGGLPGRARRAEPGWPLRQRLLPPRPGPRRRPRSPGRARAGSALPGPGAFGRPQRPQLGDHPRAGVAVLRPSPSPPPTPNPPYLWGGGAQAPAVRDQGPRRLQAGRTGSLGGAAGAERCRRGSVASRPGPLGTPRPSAPGGVLPPGRDPWERSRPAWARG